MALETALAAAVMTMGVAVSVAAWRITAVLTGVLALFGTVGAAVSAATAVAGSAATTPLVLAAACVLIAAGLLSIGYVFNHLLGPEPD